MHDLEKRIERLEYIARNSRWGDLLEQADRKNFDVTEEEARTQRGFPPRPWYWGSMVIIGFGLAFMNAVKLVIEFYK